MVLICFVYRSEFRCDGCNDINWKCMWSCSRNVFHSKSSQRYKDCMKYKNGRKYIICLNEYLGQIG